MKYSAIRTDINEEYQNNNLFCLFDRTAHENCHKLNLGIRRYIQCCRYDYLYYHRYLEAATAFPTTFIWHALVGTKNVIMLLIIVSGTYVISIILLSQNHTLSARSIPAFSFMRNCFVILCFPVTI